MTTTAFEVWLAVLAAILLTTAALSLHPRDFTRSLLLLDKLTAAWFFTGLVGLGFAFGGVL